MNIRQLSFGLFVLGWIFAVALAAGFWLRMHDDRFRLIEHPASLYISAGNLLDEELQWSQSQTKTLAFVRLARHPKWAKYPRPLMFQVIELGRADPFIPSVAVGWLGPCVARAGESELLDCPAMGVLKVEAGKRYRLEPIADEAASKILAAEEGRLEAGATTRK